jgi:hypothetical protein
MREPSVMLIAMPWHALGLPSIQLGIVGGVLEQAAIATELRSLMLAFMEHCLAETAARPEAERIELADYAMVGEKNFPLGLGDWIFAGPPFPGRSRPRRAVPGAPPRAERAGAGGGQGARHAGAGPRVPRAHRGRDPGGGAEGRGVQLEEGGRYLALALPAKLPEHV